MVVKTPFARIGDSGRVLHEYDCPRVTADYDRGENGSEWGLPTFLTREEASRFLAMWGNRPCPLCAPVLGPDRRP